MPGCASVFANHTSAVVRRVFAREGSLFEPNRSNLRSRTNAAIASQSPSSCTQEPIATQAIQKSEWPARDDMLGWLRICSHYVVCINAKK